MISFIKESLKTTEFYISDITFKEIIKRLEKEIIKNKETILQMYNIDIKHCMQRTNLDNIFYILELYKNEEIVTKNKKEIMLASYYGNPYITINLCMQALIQRRSIIAVIEDEMIGTNKILVNLFNKVLAEYKISNIIEIFNLVETEEIKKMEEQVSQILCIGNTNTFYKYKKYGIKKLKYIPFKNMALFCEDIKYKELQLELYKFAIANGIEIEIYDEEINEFIECVNLQNTLENIVIFSDKNLDEVKSKIINGKLYINENPFKNENFKLLF